MTPARTGQLAWGGLALVLLFLTAFSGWVALVTNAASDRVRSSSRLSDAYEQARYAVGAEESLERKYRLEPAPDIVASYRAAAADLEDALAQVRDVGADDDVALVDGILVDHRVYLGAMERLFAAVDAGDQDLVTEIDDAFDPVFDTIEGRIDAAAQDHRDATIQQLDDLGRTQSLVLATTPVVFVIGFALLGAFWQVMRGYQRRLADSARREIDQARQSEERFRALVQNTSDVILILDANGAIRYASPAAEHGWGYAPEALSGAPALGLVHPEDRAAAQLHLDTVLEHAGATHTTGLRIEQADGTWREVEVIAANLLDQPAVGGLALTYRDVTDHKVYERQLKQLAFHDPLTGLPNRALFSDRLEQALARADRQQRSVGLLFLDLDNFKVINDSLGHQQGDALLSQVAERLQACVRTEDTVARLGGDEFTILLEEDVTEQDASDVARRIAAALEPPITLDDREVVISASIGIAVSTPGQDRPDALLRNADLAVDQAKNDGKARHAIFTRRMQLRAVERLETESNLRRALEQGEFRVHYQPIVSLEDGRITEVEALIRWERPGQGMVSPAHFIPVAEETGLIVPIGRWVLEEACRQAVAWQATSGPLVMSVNLSGRQFQHPGLVAEVRSVLEETGLEPHLLKLEITESVAMRDAADAIATAQQLKALGIQLAIDDFGTGYSSLAYLKQFPLDTLKVDRAFVQGLGQPGQDSAIVQSVVALAETLELTVTGEGVETAEQAAHLRALGVRQAQGYLWSRPLPVAEIGRLLRGGSATLRRAA